MKLSPLLLLPLTLLLCSCGESPKPDIDNSSKGAIEAKLSNSSNGNEKSKPSNNISVKGADFACGLCFFSMKSSSCAPAIKIDQQLHWVDGMEIDHADMHKPGGICMSLRQANAEGVLKHGRFQAETVNLLPLAHKE
jgi:hypothetical protein